MVRLLGVSKSGIFFYDITLLSFLILALSWSIESGITYYAVKDTAVISPIIKLLFPLLAFQVLFSWFIIENLHLSFSIFLSVLFVLANLCTTYFSALYFAKKWFVLLNIISCCINFLVILSLFCSFFFINNGIGNSAYYVIIYILGIAFQAVSLMWILGLKYQNTENVQVHLKPLIIKIVTYSSVAFISNVMFFLVTRIDYFFVQKYCSSIALGNYVQVSKFGQLLILVPSIIAGMVFPYSADKGKTISLQKIQQLCKIIGLIFLPVILICILTGAWVLPFIFGRDFSFMYAALLLYLPGFFALSIISILAAFLAGEKHLNANLIASVIALIIVITGDVLLIPFFGINAAAAVSSIAYIACGGYLLYFYKIEYNCTITDFFYYKRKELYYFLKKLSKK